MKYLKVLLLILLLTGMGWSQSLLAQQRLYKIGFVNTGTVLKEAPQARKVEERLKAEFEAREKILLGKQQELLDIEARINNAGDNMPQSEQRRLERELRLKLSQIKFEQQEFREDQNLRRNEEIRKLQVIIAGQLKKLGDQEKFDLILTEGVSYVSDAVDITPQLIEMLKSLPDEQDSQ